MTQARWQKLTEWPLAIAAVVFLAAYSYEVVAEPGGRVAGGFCCWRVAT